MRCVAIQVQVCIKEGKETKEKGSPSECTLSLKEEKRTVNLHCPFLLLSPLAPSSKYLLEIRPSYFKTVREVLVVYRELLYVPLASISTACKLTPLTASSGQFIREFKVLI